MAKPPRTSSHEGEDEVGNSVTNINLSKKDYNAAQKLIEAVGISYPQFVRLAIQRSLRDYAMGRNPFGDEIEIYTPAATDMKLAQFKEKVPSHKVVFRAMYASPAKPYETVDAHRKYLQESIAKGRVYTPGGQNETLARRLTDFLQILEGEHLDPNDEASMINLAQQMVAKHPLSA